MKTQWIRKTALLLLLGACIPLTGMSRAEETSHMKSTPTKTAVKSTVQLPPDFVLPHNYGEVTVTEYRERASSRPLSAKQIQDGATQIQERSYLLRSDSKAKPIVVIETVANTASGAQKTQVIHEFIADEILVKLADSSTLDSLKKRLSDAGMTLSANVFRNQIFLVKLNATNLDEAEKKITEVRTWAEVKTADFNGIKRIQEDTESLPNDPQLYQQWGLEKIDAKGGWATRKSAQEVKVAVIDTGANSTHEDLSLKDGYDCANQTETMSDPVGHGTHCAGIIGAIGNNNKGISGVCQEVSVTPLRVADDQQHLLGDATLRAYDSAISLNMSLVSCSYGSPSYSTVEFSAISALHKAGIIMVAAAGNDGASENEKACYPAYYDLDNIVSVAATDLNDRLADFSNYGTTKVDIAAPGVNILSTHSLGKSDYTFMSGTSMATPCVTGILTLMKAQYPADTYLTLINRLYDSGDPVPGLVGKVKTGKRVNLAKALGGQPSTNPEFGLKAPIDQWITAADMFPCEVKICPLLGEAPKVFSFYIPQSLTAASIKFRLKMSGFKDMQIAAISPFKRQTILLKPKDTTDEEEQDFILTFDSSAVNPCSSTDYEGTFNASDSAAFAWGGYPPAGVWSLIISNSVYGVGTIESVEFYVEKGVQTELPPPVFSQNSTQCITGFDLTLTAFTPETTVRYTVDGTEPTRTSPIPPESGIRINHTQTVKAAAFTADKQSKTITNVYTFLWQGEGTRSHPYQISTRGDIESIITVQDKKSLSGIYFEVTRDIDFGGANHPWISGQDSFFGKIIGNYHCFYNIYPEIILDCSAVLFSSLTEGASISQLKFSFTSKSAGISICGFNRGEISDCSISGEITSPLTTSYYGGIAESNESNGIIKRCKSSLKTTFTNEGLCEVNVGGIVGENKGIVEDCYFNGTLKLNDVNDIIAACGGIAGENKGTIADCYANTAIHGDTTISLGALVGIAYQEGSISNCYWDIDKMIRGIAVKRGAFNITGLSSNLVASTFLMDALNHNRGWDDQWTRNTLIDPQGCPVLLWEVATLPEPIPAPVPAAIGTQFTVTAKDLNIEKFSKKPSAKGTYTDINGREKKTAVKVVKGFTKDDDKVELELVGKVKLYNAKTLRQYYAEGRSVVEFIAKEQDSQKEVSLSLKMGRENLTYPSPILITAPVLDSVHAQNSDSALIQSLSVLEVKGHFIGKKAPKAWLEYQKNGKTLKRTLTVKRQLYTFSPESNASDFTVTAPKRFPAEFINGQSYILVIDNGSGLAAAPVTFIQP